MPWPRRGPPTVGERIGARTPVTSAAHAPGSSAKPGPPGTRRPGEPARQASQGWHLPCSLPQADRCHANHFASESFLHRHTMNKRKWMVVDGNEAVASVACGLSEVVAIDPTRPASPMWESCRMSGRPPVGRVGGHLSDEWAASCRMSGRPLGGRTSGARYRPSWKRRAQSARLGAVERGLVGSGCAAMTRQT